jgi:translation initiation factor IF-3
VNKEIQTSMVLLILEDGNQFGFTPIENALRIAEDRGFDLVEVVEGTCKLMDLGLMKFNESKKPKAKKEKLKQAQFNVGISDHDFKVKVRNIENWLSEGARVNIKVQLRGRLAQRPELAQELSIKIMDSVSEGQLSSPPRMAGDRDMVFSFQPSA